MMKPVVLIALGAVAGSIVGVIDGSGGMGRDVADALTAAAAPLHRLIEARALQPRPAKDAISDDVGAIDGAHAVFTTCLRRSGTNAEQSLRDLLEFHEHDTSVALVGCLLDGDPQRFCTP